MTSAECPFANVNRSPLRKTQSCPHHEHLVPMTYSIRQPVPLAIRNGTHMISEGTASLLRDIGGGDRIREFCTRFYARAFQDFTLAPFMFHDDGATAHGKRLGDWIIEKMGGEGAPWTDSGRHGMRQPSHYAAWNSDKREPSARGRRFKLDDARVWMRIHFWAARECGLDQHEVFWMWYIEFIQHFIAVYDRKAPIFTEDDAQWSADADNIRRYHLQGNKMVDVLSRL